jgi:hypothetical protein
VKRVVSVVDSSQAAFYTGNDTGDKQLLILRSYTPLQVYEFHDFVAKYPEFLLYSGGKEWDWWPARLVNEGYVLRLVGVHENRKVYLVSQKHETSGDANASVSGADSKKGPDADSKKKVAE